MIATIPAIPTFYKGIRFRSRLEAKWAAFMTLLGWSWEYEPFDLDNYIPDFILDFNEPTILEVKPSTDYQELETYQGKIEAAGWSGPALIVGAKIFESNLDGWPEGYLVAGPLAEPDSTDRTLGIFDWHPASFMLCDWATAESLPCGRISLAGTEAGYQCLRCGCNPGSQYLPRETSIQIQAKWREAGNEVQWNPS